MATDQRTQTWLDGLADDERARAVHVLDLPGGGHAAAYAAVDSMRTAKVVKSMEARLPIIVNEAVLAAIPKPVKGDIITLAASAAFTTAMMWLAPNGVKPQ